MQDDKGNSHYIDLESIKHTPSGIARIVKKVKPKDSSDYSSLVSEIEMDCKGNKIRTLKETSFNKNGKGSTTQKDGKWQQVNTEDLDELLLELVCSLKKVRI